MQYNKLLKISIGASRWTAMWKEQEITVEQLISKLANPVVTTESFAEYKSFPKAKQDDLKDVGGFVGGILKGGIRRSGNMIARYIIALDADNIEPGGTQHVLNAVDGLGCNYIIYSTKKHESSRPRLRILFPLDRPCSADEYEAVARKIASYIGINLFDPTTFEPERLMYWPSRSKDGEFVFTYGDKPFLSVDGMLAAYNDWKNCAEWPAPAGAAKIREKQAKKQGNPLEKQGAVGAFCRAYTIEAVINKFLPDVYSPCDTSEGRYTYIPGSTVGGAVVYEDGKFLFSHHATDPAGGKLCNAFDLVRYHLFGELDDEAKPNTPTVQMPSYRQMLEFVVSDDTARAVMQKERLEQAQGAFKEPFNEEDNTWLSKLQVHPQTGAPMKTIDNILIILQNDSAIKGKLGYDEFAERCVVLGDLPWTSLEKGKDQRWWNDTDEAGILHYLEKVYNLCHDEKTKKALALCFEKNKFNPLKDYLNSLEWDGVKRLDTLVIDYFGAADNTYVRAVTRKTLCAAVARAMTPGIKFDPMLILVGAQGSGKTTFFKKLGVRWFSDSFETFSGKDAAEAIQGYWIIEAGELSALKFSERETTKQFLSRCYDIYRVPYGKHTKQFPRRCIFVGTTNKASFLKDDTGGRRFWPIDIGIKEATKKVFRDLDAEVDQIWAEAVIRYRAGEALTLSDEIEEFAKREQESHREVSPKEGIIIEFVNRKIPEDFYKWDIGKRKGHWSNPFINDNDDSLVERTKICAAEIWVECFNGDLKQMKRSDVCEINAVLGKMEGWKKSNFLRFGANYGNQRGYSRS